MRVGIGLPATLPGTLGRTVLEWAVAADAGPFSSLAVLDRVLYDNYESLTVLGAVSAITHRISLAATIIIAPLRSTALLAKQAATVQALSGGRLVLGLGLGARPDDYVATGARYTRRGRTLTEQVVGLRNIWEDGRIGPVAGVDPQPCLLVGGAGRLAMSRMARYADGYIYGGGTPRAFAREALAARAAWQDAGRPGRPHLWSMAYFALDADAEAGAAYLRDYYAFTGPFADRIAAGLLTTPEAIHEFLLAYADAGCDELVLFPAAGTSTQVAQLAEIVAG